MTDVVNALTGEILRTYHIIYYGDHKREINRWIKSIGFTFDHLEIGWDVETVYVRPIF